MAVALVATAACGGDSGDSPTTTSTITATRTVAAPTQTTTTTATQEPASTQAAAPPATSPEAGGGGVMPAVVCMNLQAAQDLIQEQGVFFSRSHDATGQGRRQISDRNWIVVEQSPAPGTPISEGDADLGAVKIGEPAPC